MQLSKEELELMKNDVQAQMMISRSGPDDMMRTNCLAFLAGEIEKKNLKSKFKDCEECGSTHLKSTVCPKCNHYN